MGLTTHSIHCRLEGRPEEDALAAIEAALRRLLEARGLVAATGPEDAARALFLVPGQGPWISIFDTDFEQTETLAANLSRDPGLPAVSLQIFDSDHYYLKLFQDGKPVARLSGGAGRSKTPKIARAWLDLMPAGTAAEDVAAALSGQAVFAEEHARAFAARLGIDPELCLQTSAGFWEALPAGGRRLIYRAPAGAAPEEPPRFRLSALPGAVKLSVGEALHSLSTCALNHGGAARGLRVRVAGDLAAAGALEVNEIAVVRFPESLRGDAPPERIAAAPVRAADGTLEALFPDVRIPGMPRTGSVQAVNAGWRAASVYANLAGRAAAPGAGTLSTTIEPLEDPAGAAVAAVAVEIVDAPRLPLRACPGQEKAARDLADPSVLIAMASLGPDRDASAGAVCAAIEGWLDAAPGDWVVTLQRDAMDFDLKPARVGSVRRAKSKRWKEALEAAASSHLLFGTLDPDPRTGIGRAAFVLDASRQPFGLARGVAPQLCLWTEAASAPPGAAATLRGLLQSLVAQARPLQAFLARWSWKPLSLGATLYETACGIAGPALLTPEWCGRYLRGVGDFLWLSRQLAAHLDRAAVEAAAEVRESGGGWWVELRDPGGIGALETALAPLLPGREEWQEAMRR